VSIKVVEKLSPEEFTRQTDALASRLCAICTGAHPGALGAALAETVAIWIALHQLSAAERAELIAMHARAVSNLVPIMDEGISNLQRAGRRLS
jgi:hypothetical protein